MPHSEQLVAESDINLIDSVDEIYGRTPLIICSYKKTEAHFQIARYLLDCGCDVNVQANYKWNNWVSYSYVCLFSQYDIVIVTCRVVDCVLISFSCCLRVCVRVCGCG